MLDLLDLFYRILRGKYVVGLVQNLILQDQKYLIPA